MMKRSDKNKIGRARRGPTRRRNPTTVTAFRRAEGRGIA
jgi:hypothetical protein